MGKVRFSRKQLCIPYAIYLFCFVFVPLLVLLYYAFTDAKGNVTIQNFIHFFSQSNTMGTLLYSLMLAFATTVVCLLIAYPVAFILAKSNVKNKAIVLMIFVMPMWINFTLRVTALKEILTAIEHNLAFYPFLNSVIGMTYDFLPFMIMPIYSTIIGIDHNLLEAARDLGAGPVKAFLSVILPLSVPGIISGITMVFLPAMTNYVVLDMLYNSTYIMGSLIGSYFSAYDWHNGSMIAIILLGIILIVTLMTGKVSEEHSEQKGGAL